MPSDLNYGVGAYRRDEGSLPELKLVNMWVEPTPASEKGVILQSRPGLLSSATWGGGPITGLFQKDGVFGGDTFAVSGGRLYRAGALVGTIDGTGPVSFAASPIELVLTAGTTAYSYTSAGLAAIAFPDGANVTAVGFLAGYFVYARAGSHRFYWSEILDGRDIDGLSFAAAESAPDPLVDLAVIQDELWLIGSETIEPWQPTGIAETPFIRSQGRLYRKGAIGPGCSQELDNTLFWITHERTVCRGGQVPERISDHGIEERISASATVSTFRFLYRGHLFFCVRLDEGTWAYDVATGQWCELSTFGFANFLGQCAVDVDGEPLFGSSEDGTLYGFSAHQDAGQQLVRLWTAAAPLEGPFSMFNLLLGANVGQTPFLSGDYIQPVVEMRTSRDAGQTWSDWREAPLGAQGEYRRRTIWRRFPVFDPPGIVIEFRCSDPVPLRVSTVKVNVPMAGRGR